MRYFYYFIIMGFILLLTIPVLIVVWDSKSYGKRLRSYSDATTELLGLDT